MWDFILHHLKSISTSNRTQTILSASPQWFFALCVLPYSTSVVLQWFFMVVVVLYRPLAVLHLSFGMVKGLCSSTSVVLMLTDCCYLRNLKAKSRATLIFHIFENEFNSLRVQTSKHLKRPISTRWFQNTVSKQTY